jgi:DUF1680 family protein
MTKYNPFSRRAFIGGAAALAGAHLIPSSASAFVLQDPVQNSIDEKGQKANRERVPWAALPFPLKQVRLLPGACLTIQETNTKYLRSLPVDRLAHSFRLTSNFPSQAEPFGGWEKPDSELRGHFTGGHYLSAVALTYASAGDEELRKNGDALVAILAQCQDANKNGYVSAFPVEFFDRLRDRVKVWAPFYTIHKIMAGLLDMYTLAGNAQALDVCQKMAGWADSYAAPLSYDHMQRVLETEYGGMGEVLCNLYAITGNRQYLGTARRFEKKAFFDPLDAHRDELRGLHVNTHIPQVIAAARSYELTREPRYRNIAEYFLDEVLTERSYCNGGTSEGEHWQTDPGKLTAQQLSGSTTEDCCAYNMMKLTRHLFGWAPEARHMDYYERVVFNHRLGTIDPSTGTTMYYYPLGIDLYKTYGTPNDSFWCCNGTGVEEFAKLADTIYFHDDDSVYVNLFIASELSWPEKNLRLRQETNFPVQQGTKLIVATDKPSDVSIRVRIPYWAQGGSVKVNGRTLPVFASPSSYLTLRGPWKTGDSIELNLPMGLHTSPLPGDETVQAPMYGPLVLAARHEETPKESWYGSSAPRRTPGATPPTMPAATAKLDDSVSWIEPVPNQALSFRTVGQATQGTLVPVNQIVHERYDVYWKVSPPPQTPPGRG